jgi:hypothetical protein
MVIRRALSVGRRCVQPAPGIRQHVADILSVMQACVRDPFRVLMPTIPVFVVSSTDGNTASKKRSALSKLDNYRFTVSAVRAFKCAPVISALIAWLKLQKKHDHTALGGIAVFPSALPSDRICAVAACVPPKRKYLTRSSNHSRIPHVRFGSIADMMRLFFGTMRSWVSVTHRPFVWP